ncbi:MAG: UbiD family decarboxylase, partial [Geminicoccaceae bacterium]|nr:UbiD family decarboxylase [Geminicoccaceae bacterium]
MPFDSLRDFVQLLERRGRLVRVSAKVSPVLEITEIHTRLLAEGGPAVLFENVEGSAIPLLTNLFGTVERVAWGMDREPHELRELGRMLAFFRQPQPPESMSQALELLPYVKVALAMKPKTIGGRTPCQEVILRGGEIDLGRFPIQTCWPGEPAPLITWPLVVTKGPGETREDKFNLGIYRMQVLDRDKTIVRWLAHRGGAQHHRRWKA